MPEVVLVTISCCFVDVGIGIMLHEELHRESNISKLKRGMQPVKLTLFLRFVLFISIFFVVTTPALASVYVFERGGNNASHNAHPVSIADTTYYVYGILSPGQSTVDYYELDFANNVQQVEVRLLIPKSSSASFHPNFVLTDGTLGRVSGEAPFGFPREKGGKVYNWQGIGQQSFTDTHVAETFTIGPGLIGDFSVGQRLLAVFDPQGIGGRYVLKIGSRQGKESLKDKIASAIAYIRIKLQIY